MKHRVALAFDRGRVIHGKRPSSDPDAPPDAPTVTNFTVSATTQTSITMTWSTDQYVTGYLRWGTIPTSLPNVRSPGETSFAYQTHIQQVTGLTAGTTYYFQAYGENSEGDGYTTEVVGIDTQADTTGGGTINYTDYSLSGVTSYGGFSIDPNGNVDSSRGINAWIQAQPDGADAQNHSRLIFPPTARYRLGTAALCVGDKQHTTLWGHDSSSSAWIRGDATSYTDVGCELYNIYRSTPGAPYGSCIITGAIQSGTGTYPYSLGRFTTDVVIRGFDITSTHPNRGVYQSSHEGDAVIEMGGARNVEFAYNRATGMGGDLVRFRTAKDSWVHHNYCLDVGRMGCTAVINIVGETRSDNVFEDNTIDRCGYWGIDLEPEDHSTDSERIYRGLVVRNNRWGSFASSGVGGGFAVIGGTATPGPGRVIADVEISGNVLDGYSYGTWGTSEERDLWTISQHVVTNSARRISNFTFRDNSQDGFAYQGGYSSVLTVKYCDGLIVTNNDANYGGSNWLADTGCTSVVESGNT